MDADLKRLKGTYQIYRAGVNGIRGSMISSVNALNYHRQTIIAGLDGLSFTGRLSGRKFQSFLDEMRMRGISLKVDHYPTNRTEVKSLRDKVAQKYEKKTQFLIDQAIVALAISYEEFIRRLFIKYYTDDPRRISEDKEIDAESLLTLGTVAGKLDLAGVHQELAENIATKLQRNSAQQWFRDLEKRLKLVLEEEMYGSQIGQIIELFLVRNSIVHNARFITKELVAHKEKFIGLKVIRPTMNDFKRYSTSCERIVGALFRKYNERYSATSLNIDLINSELIRVHRQNSQQIEPGVKLNISRSEINALTKKYKDISLTHIRTLLVSNFTDSKLLGLKILIHQYKFSKEPGLRRKIFIFCLLNIDLFETWEMINLLTRNIITGPRLAGHNIQLLESMASFRSPKRAYLLLRVINASPDIATRRHLAWIVNKIERQTIAHTRGGERRRLVSLHNRTVATLNS